MGGPISYNMSKSRSSALTRQVDDHFALLRIELEASFALSSVQHRKPTVGYGNPSLYGLAVPLDYRYLAPNDLIGFSQLQTTIVYSRLIAKKVNDITKSVYIKPEEVKSSLQ